VHDEAQNSSVTGARLMDLATDLTTDSASLSVVIADARLLIEAVGRGEHVATR
jgi:hypothetical protein